MIKLNIGCGNDIKEGFINMDKYPINKSVIRFDFDKEKLPFDNNSVDYVYMRHSLEHINERQKAVMEILRVLKDGGVFKCILPTNSPCITHKSYRHIKGYFKIFIANNRYDEKYGCESFSYMVFKYRLISIKGLIYRIVESIRNYFSSEYEWEMIK